MLALTPRFTVLLALCLVVIASPAHPLNPHVSLGVNGPYGGTTTQINARRTASTASPEVTDASFDASSPAPGPYAHAHHHNGRAAPPALPLSILPSPPNATSSNNSNESKDDTLYLNTPEGNQELVHHHQEPRENPVEQQLKHGNFVTTTALPALPTARPSAPATPARRSSDDNVVDAGEPIVPVDVVYHYHEEDNNHQRSARANKDISLGAQGRNGTGANYHDHQEQNRRDHKQEVDTKLPRGTTDDKTGTVNATGGNGVRYHHHEGRSEERRNPHHHHHD